MNSNRIEEIYHTLHFLHSRRNKRFRTEIIKIADKQLLDELSECCLNILEENLDLDEDEERALLPFAGTIRKLTHKKTSNHLRRKYLLQQRGTFLSALLPVAIAVIGSKLE